ncbi:MAG: CBS domain-containing protein [Gammaproteobacteria bacterium]|nr:CBS domain-containing protein [Gammaproteobacteria bacterium]NNJ95980.1 CBS domain-containing protein [Gammaproteobacteria bacterium]
MITVEEFMTTEPWTLHETDSIDDAREIMTDRHIRHIPVTDGDNHLVGLVTQRDILAATDPVQLLIAKSASNTGAAGLKIADIMTRNVSVVGVKDSLREAALYLQSHKYGCMPVVTDDRLVGIITDSDFIAIAINLIEQAELNEEDLSADDVM